MALINKIREKSGVAVIIIAVALILFIVGGDIIGSGLFGGGQQDQTLGKIAGETITAQEFQAKLDQARQTYESQAGRAAQEQELQSLREQVWNQYLIDYAYKKEYDALGLSVSDDELTDMVQGNNINAIVRQNFTSPQTGVFDKTAVISYLKNLKNMPLEQQKAWQGFEKSLAEARLREKYENLLKATSYTTKAEAEKEYQTQTAKASLKYLFVPFYAVADTTVKVEDSELSNYLSAHKDEFKGFDSRKMQYITFAVAPSKEDSAALYNNIKTLARGMATTTNDSAFVRVNSDIQTPMSWSMAEMPAQLKAAVRTFIPGSVNGPYKEGNTYYLYKYLGTATDTAYTVKASHILINAAKTASDSVKADARRRAEDILRQLKGGANFEALATTSSQDPGSAQQGGDLGYFREGTMVKPFNDAVFKSGSSGLLANVVESDFGFHIIKITEPKSNVKYRVAAIGKTLESSQTTRDAAYAKADAFVQQCKSKADFDEMTKKDKNLIVSTATQIAESSTNINTIQNAREIVRWTFNDDTDIDQVSPVFETPEQYVVGVLTGKTSKDSPKVDDFREQLLLKVRNEIKGKQISEKLSGISGATLEDVAKKYGAGALVETANDITLGTGFLTSAGIDPIALGKGFGVAKGKRTKVFTGENGVFLMERLNDTPAPAIADYSQFKNSAQQRNAQSISYYTSEAIRENAKVVDRRAKFF
jgi:peptidyl-prolyl cis-trans isomerase D